MHQMQILIYGRAFAPKFTVTCMMEKFGWTRKPANKSSCALGYGESLIKLNLPAQSTLIGLKIVVSILRESATW